LLDGLDARLDCLLDRQRTCLERFFDRLDASLDASKSCLRGLPEWKRLGPTFVRCGFGSRRLASETRAEPRETSEYRGTAYGADSLALAIAGVCEPPCIGLLVQLRVMLPRESLDQPGLHRSSCYDSGLRVTVPSRLL
jgi:hypothetical protein